MKQKEIKALLEEASQPDCSWQRRNQIQCELIDALIAFRPVSWPTGTGRIEGFKLILEKLYVDTLHYYPMYLPNLFPVFAMICGERDDDMIVADVIWSLSSNSAKDCAVWDDLKEAKCMLKAYQPLGTPEEIRSALDVSFRMLATINVIRIAIEKSGCRKPDTSVCPEEETKFFGMTAQGIEKEDFMKLPLRDFAIEKFVGQRFRWDDKEPKVGEFVCIIEVVEVVDGEKEQVFSSPIKMDSPMPETLVKMELKLYQIT